MLIARCSHLHSSLWKMITTSVGVVNGLYSGEDDATARFVHDIGAT